MEIENSAWSENFPTHSNLEMAHLQVASDF